MEKNNSVVAATNEKVSTAYISDDIAFSILSKLPLKSFKRFECLRKSWSTLCKNHHFMDMFRCNFLSNSHCEGASLLLFDNENCNEVLYCVSGERFKNKIKLDFSNAFKKYLYFDIFSSINGTICLHQNEQNNYRKIVLWNPTTKIIKLLPCSKVESENFSDIYVPSRLHGFGYNHVTNDYNVIQLIKVCIKEKPSYDYSGDVKEFVSYRTVPKWEIYSLRSNSWRELDVDMPSSVDCTEGTQIYMDGVCHWLCEKHKDNPIGPCLVSFYLSNEVSFTTAIPPDVDDCFDVKAKWKNLVVLNGYIALISYRKETSTFRVSILGQLGFKESWIKLFMVGPLPYVERPIGVGTKGEIFFIRKDKEVAWFDLSTQMIDVLGYTTEGFHSLCRMINYKESIVPFEE
ncbi:putative F-box domain-containing protein [Medicago truncatula]|uniref:Putative F-box domain-containing protein n=1 Tax=Medicago truncatula TaxID=3880 RepID=A0A396HKG8_MEDTR|nr:putative F-box domain-containing protein [Medicago truncatula]